MSGWSLSRLLEGLHEEIQQRLATARGALFHPGSKGDASERIWLALFQKYLPQRYQAEKAHVVDSNGNVSQQIDVVIFDRQYSPFIFICEEQKFIPAESVYAVFEAKQAIDTAQVAYAREKIRSVRALHRTSLPIPYAGGTYPAKPLIPILGGILTFESDWSPPLGDTLRAVLLEDQGERRLDIGCVAAHGYFYWDRATECYNIVPGSRAATAFLFKLISVLQFSGTVPMIDVEAYAQWLTKKELASTPE
jgi:hypothetical protein